MSKLSKFLDSRAVKTDSCSESLYYDFCGKSIRVSNHLPRPTEIFDINIIFPKNKNHTYLLVLNQQIFIYDSFTPLKVFLESFFLIIESGVDKVKNTELTELRALRKQSGIIEGKYQRLKNKYDHLLTINDNIITSNLTPRQLETVKSWIVSNRIIKPAQNDI